MSEQEVTMYEDFILCADARIHVLGFGIQGLPQLKECKDVIVIIPGNPGEITFYEYFMRLLYEALGQKWVIIGISHTGHSSYQVLRNTNVRLYQGTKKDLWGLNDQIRFKLAFIEEHINKSARIIMIGHSVGAYISIEMLNQNRSLEQQVVKLICVFPTIERMGETSLGKLYSFLFDWFYYPALMMVYAIDFLVPQKFRPNLVEYILGGGSRGVTKRAIPPCAHKAALSIAKPLAVQNIVHMASSEFKQINEPNLIGIKRLGNKITILHGDKDAWAPLEYWIQLKEALPDCDIRLALSGHDHAFVLHEDSTVKISEMIIDILKPIIANSN